MKKQIKSHSEACTQALVLTLTAPSATKFAEAAALAEYFATWLSPDQFKQAKQEALARLGNSGTGNNDPIPANDSETHAPGWKYLGDVGVDSGCLCLGDPCYQDMTPGLTMCPGLDDQGLMNTCTDRSIAHANGNDGLAVIFDSSDGDGLYEVFIRRACDEIMLRILRVPSEDELDYRN